jgi:2-polyprenyl-6-methoxyphenol hydroxylase-like FAD-dependent oxidoreductase
MTGNLLRSAGWDVDVYERSSQELDSRGGGIVLQPQVVEVLRRSGYELPLDQLGVRSLHRTVIRPDGSIQSRVHAPQLQTSWSLIYTMLRDAFGLSHYHPGHTLSGVTQTGDKVTATFLNDHSVEADLLVGADGGGSTVRQLLWADSEPEYAGYLAWRGLLPEDALPQEAREVLSGDFAFANHQGSHILGYLVPGEDNDLSVGGRFYNWVWYRVVPFETMNSIMTDSSGQRRGWSLPQGQLAASWKEALDREAEQLLPPAFRAVVRATDQPFVQAIRDLVVDQMVDHRVLLLGDAAAIPRPHTAASTAKAATNALALADSLLASPHDLSEALQRWERPQLDLAHYLYKSGREIGDHLLFSRRRTSDFQ